MAFRVIHFSNDSGSIEGAFFTEDMEIDAYNCISDKCDVVSDTIIDEDLPSSFPMDYILLKK